MEGSSTTKLARPLSSVAHKRRIHQSLAYLFMMASLSWRTTLSRAMVASFAASAASLNRSSLCHLDRPDRSRSALCLQRRSYDNESESQSAQKRQDAREEEFLSEEMLREVSPTLSRATRSARQLRAGVSRIFSAAGFFSSSTTSLIRDREQLQRLKVTVEAFQNFLTSSGIDVELRDALNLRLLDNLIILGRVQKAALQGEDIRDTVLLSVQPTDMPSNEESYRYMRFSTAAYGAAMIRAAEMDVTGKFDPRFTTKEVIKTRMSQHVGIPEEDMAVLDVDYDGNSMHLRYFIAVDHVEKKVILAIRGTFSISEIITDVAAFSRPFCGGEAHSEMATIAERTWQVVGPTIVRLLEENPTYELVLTGHSLGAGCAALLNIMCHEDNNKLVNGRPVRCFAFACPPVFAPLEAAPRAIKACTGYTNAMDVVPFLSVDSVRHVFASIRAIEELNLSWSERMQLVTGFIEPDEELAQAVAWANERRLAPKHGAPVLCIPAQAVVWLREKDQTGTFDPKLCDPAKISRTPVQIDIDMLQDHFASRYEHVLHHIEGSLE